MTTTKSNNKFVFLPPSDLHCIWMTSGIISYKLCNRKFECDNCPLDIALKKQYDNEQPAICLKDSVRLQNECQYTEKHLWLDIKNHHCIRVGIEPRLTSAFLIPGSIVLPEKSQHLVHQQATAWIIFNNGTFPILSPMDGTVIDVNISLAENPQKLFDHPFDSGWLFEIDPDEPLQLSTQILDSSKAQKVYNKDSLRFKDALLNALRKSYLPVGITMADGGMPLRDISDILGAKIYFDIVREIFGS